MMRRNSLAAATFAVATALAAPAWAQHHDGRENRGEARGRNDGEARGHNEGRQAAPSPRGAEAGPQQAPDRGRPAPQAEQNQRRGQPVPRSQAQQERPQAQPQRVPQPRVEPQAVPQPRAIPRPNDSRSVGTWRGDNRGANPSFSRPSAPQYRNRGPVYAYRPSYRPSFAPSYRPFYRPTFRAGFAPVYQPYYNFRPRVRVGFGLWIGFPVVFPSYYDPYYAYPAAGYPAPGTITAAATGGLSFDLSPEDADLWIDGQYAGTVGEFSPSDPPLAVTPGRHRVEIAADGFQPLSFDVDIVRGQVIPYQGSMQPE